VIEAHADGFKYTGGTTIAYSDPVFEVKKVSKADIVLVIDVSGSMDSYSRIDNAARAAKNFVDRAEQDSYVAVVKFDSTASTEIGLTKITDDASRTTIKNEIPTDDSGGSTSIGAGMQQAKGILDASTHNLNKVMVLLTDGEENTDPMIADVLQDVVDANIKVYSVGLGAASDQQLQDVADQTGGVYYFAQDEDIQALNEAYTSAALQIASLPGNTVANETLSIPGGTSDTFEALIDSSLGNHTLFTFSGPASNMAYVTVTLTQPDNVTINSSYSGFSRDDTLGIILFRIEGVAQSGTWTANVSNSGTNSAEINMEVTSSQAPSEAAITLSTWLSKNAVIYPEPVGIYASLFSTESIIESYVWAEVTPPSGAPITVVFSDDGQGADRFQLDGVYSGYFTQYSGDGRYSVRVFADNASGSAQLGAQFKDGPGIQSDQGIVTAVPGNMVVSDELGVVARTMSNPAAELNQNFERISGAGAFELAGFVAGDAIEPNQILSLSVIGTSQVPPAIVLGWIAPGDDISNGTAASYDLRYSQTPITRDNFDSAPQASGLSAPQPVGAEEQYTVLNLDCNKTYYFAMKAADDAGNISEMSNVISGMIADITPPTIDSLSVNPSTLWPANHKMVPVVVDVISSDNCDTEPLCEIISVNSNEPINGLGDGDEEPDWANISDLTADLRAERSGTGDGRIYTITVECTDEVGNATTANVNVSVPHNKSK
jgi:Mg-chelatase subunit ChlD